MKNKIWIHAGAGSIELLTPETREGIRLCAVFYSEKYGSDLYVTHMGAGIHSIGSHHPFGRAFDINYPYGYSLSDRLKGKLQKKLGNNFDIVLHSSHVHVEYDPKKK
jgi:hypothetical protein